MALPRELLSWKLLRDQYIDPKIPIEHPVLAEPDLSLVFDPDAGCLGMRLQFKKGQKLPGFAKLRNIIVRRVLLNGGSYIEVLTELPSLFKSIYALIGDVLTRISDGEPDCLRALEASLRNFEGLLAKASTFSHEQAVGLYGELWVLRRILVDTDAGVSSWTGPDRQSHDFRLATGDLEVKTTTGSIRRHVVHGLNQLSPLPDRPLRLISIQLVPSGGSSGRTLNELVRLITELIREDQTSIDLLLQGLNASGYDSRSPECETHYQLLSPPRFVTVGVEVPALSEDWFVSALGTESAARFSEFSFLLNLEGLGLTFDRINFSGGAE